MRPETWIKLTLSVFIILPLLPSGYANTCTPTQYIHFDGTCINNCATLTGAANPSSHGLECLCTGTQKINNARSRCVASCDKTNDNNYLDNTGKKCNKLCGQYVGVYLNIDKTQCIDDCSSTGIFGIKNPSYGGTCVCQVNEFIDFLAKKCLPSCTSSQYGDTSDSKCKACNSNCATCSGPLATDCLTCNTGLFSNPTGECKSTCPPNGYWPSTVKGVCLICDMSCLTCSGPSNKECTQCPSDRILMNGECLSNCPSGTYKIIETGIWTCRKCEGSCLTCSDHDVNLCLSCKDGSYLFNKRCWPVDGCPDGRFPNQATKTCDLCNSKCKTCSSFSICTSCPIGLYLENNDCVTRCSDGTYGDSVKGICAKCNPSCSLCNGGTEYSCVTCPAKYYREADGSCLPRFQCPDGTFQVEVGDCQLCENQCQTCAGLKSTCTSCRLPYILKDKNCILPELNSCGDGYISDIALATCIKCEDPCQTCFNNPNFCTKCNDPKYTAIENGNCVICPKEKQNCDTCKAGPTCTACKTDFLMIDGTDTCVKDCSEKYYKFEKTCKLCSDALNNCGTCSNNTMCESCQSGYYMMIPDKKSCVKCDQADESVIGQYCYKNTEIKFNELTSDTGIASFSLSCPLKGRFIYLVGPDSDTLKNIEPQTIEERLISKTSDDVWNIYGAVTIKTPFEKNTLQVSPIKVASIYRLIGFCTDDEKSKISEKAQQTTFTSTDNELKSLVLNIETADRINSYQKLILVCSFYSLTKSVLRKELIQSDEAQLCPDSWVFKNEQSSNQQSQDYTNVTTYPTLIFIQKETVCCAKISSQVKDIVSKPDFVSQLAAKSGLKIVRTSTLDDIPGKPEGKPHVPILYNIATNVTNQSIAIHLRTENYPSIVYVGVTETPKAGSLQPTPELFRKRLDANNRPIDYYEVRDLKSSAGDVILTFNGLDQNTKYSIYYFAADRQHPENQDTTPLVTYSRVSEFWQPPQYPYDGEESRGAEVGVGVGVIFGILLLVVVIACIVVKCSKKKKSKTETVQTKEEGEKLKDVL